jgi:hypothetical protein
VKKWLVHDRSGHEIYLTEERWQHIVERHRELRNCREDVLATIQKGHRHQQPQDPQAYVYRRPSNKLPPPFNGILAVVAFRFEWQDDGSMVPNNFVTTAWGIIMRR